VDRLHSNRTWSAFAGAAMMIAIVPAVIVIQTGRASEPWDNPWVEPWPALLDRPAAVEPELTSLQQRIDASLERLLKPGAVAPQSDPL